MLKGKKERTVPGEMLDLKEVSEKLETLPHDSLMYVAGAISALAAANNTKRPIDPVSEDSA